MVLAAAMICVKYYWAQIHLEFKNLLSVNQKKKKKKKNPKATWDHPFITLAKFSEELTFLTPWYAHVRVRISG